MSLDAYPGDEAVRRLAAERTAARSHRGVTLDPDSPLRPAPTPRRARRILRQSLTEHEIQVALFAKIDDPAEQRRRPALALAFAVPNGGKRSIGVAAKLKAEGVRAGVLDVWLPVARGGYHGYVLELKRPGATTTPEQAHWLSALAREGWYAALHTTSEGAWAEMIAYLDYGVG